MQTQYKNANGVSFLYSNFLPTSTLIPFLLSVNQYLYILWLPNPLYTNTIKAQSSGFALSAKIMICLSSFRSDQRVLYVCCMVLGCGGGGGEREKEGSGRWNSFFDIVLLYVGNSQVARRTD